MIKKPATWMGIALIAVIAMGCGQNKNFRTPFDSITQREYIVYGRVMDMTDSPVENCMVVLVKQDYRFGADKTKGYFPVATTDKTGDFEFMFEPHGANGVWLYFDAKKQGYTERFVEFSPLVGNTIFQAGGNNPVNVSVILERSPLEPEPMMSSEDAMPSEDEQKMPETE